MDQAKYGYLIIMDVAPIVCIMQCALSLASSQVVFPERPGALRTFLSIISPKFNITLFHYRKSGVQLPASLRVDFAVLKLLASDCCLVVQPAC